MDEPGGHNARHERHMLHVVLICVIYIKKIELRNGE